MIFFAVSATQEHHIFAIFVTKTTKERPRKAHVCYIFKFDGTFHNFVSAFEESVLNQILKSVRL